MTVLLPLTFRHWSKITAITLFTCLSWLYSIGQNRTSFSNNNKITFLSQDPLDGNQNENFRYATLPSGITIVPQAKPTDFNDCNSSTFYMHLAAGTGEKIELKDVQTRSDRNFILAGNITHANNEKEGILCVLTNTGNIVTQRQVRINNHPTTLFAMRTMVDGRLLIAGIMHDAIGKPFLSMLNADLSVNWTQTFNPSSSPSKVTMDLVDNNQLTFAFQHSGTITYALLNIDGSIAWSKETAPPGLDELVGFTQLLFTDLGLETNCTRGGKKVVELSRMTQAAGNFIISHTVGDGNDENKFYRPTTYYHRLITLGVVRKPTGQYRLIRSITYASAFIETEHTYTIPGNVDFNITAASDKAGDALAYCLPADGKLVFIRHFADYQSAPSHSRQYTVPTGASVAGATRSSTDGGFLFGLNTSDASELILIKTDSVGKLAACSYEEVTATSTETLHRINTQSTLPSTTASLAISPASLSSVSSSLASQFDCNENYCPPPPEEDTCLTSYYKILRSNSHADAFNNYYLVRNNQHIAITARYDRVMGNEMQLTYGVKLYNERGEYIKGMNVYCNDTSRPVLARQMDDQHIMLIVYTPTQSVPRYTFTLINDNLDIIWSKAVQTFSGYNFSSSGLMGDMIKDQQGNYYFVGCNVGFMEPAKVMAYKMDASGNQLWLKIHELQAPNLLLNTIAATATHSSLVMAVEGSISSGGGSVSIRLDKNTGQMQNAFVYQNGSAGAVYNRCLRFDHDRIFYTGNDANSNLVIGTFDTTGRPIKFKHLANSSIARAATSNAGMLYVMYNYYNGSEHKDVLLKADSTLTLQFNREFDVLLFGYPVGLAVGTNGSIYAGGNFYNGTYNHVDPYIRKFEPDGTPGTCSYQNAPGNFTDINLNIFPINTNAINQSFVQVNIPMTFVAEPDGQRVGAVLCSSTNECDTVIIAGPALVCGLDQPRTYTATSNAGCTLEPVWVYDTAYIELQTDNGSSAEIRFKRTGSTWIKTMLNTGCHMYRDSLLVQIQDSPADFSLGNDKALCLGDTIRLGAGNGFDTYLWQDGSTDSIFIVTVPGQYHVQAANLCGDNYADTINILPVTVPQLYIGNDSSVCKRDTLHFLAAAGFSVYNWQSSVGIVNQSGQQAYIVPLQDAVISLEATTSEGCKAFDTLYITSIEARPISLGKDTSLCSLESLVLNAGTGYSEYNWSNGGNGPTINVTDQGTYHIQAVDVNGCIARDTLTIQQVHALPVFDIGDDFDLCDGDPKTLDPGTFNQYHWQNGSTSRHFTVSAPGTYWVRVTDNHQCSSADTVVALNIRPAPSGFLAPIDTICQYDKITIQALSNYDSYSWSTGSSQSSITVEVPGHYSLTVIDDNGCSGKDTIRIVEKMCYTGIYIPTAFTPNGDQLNDLFKARVYGIIQSFRIEVYNRNGELVFITTEPTRGWDGKIAGVMQASGVFVWQCYYAFPGENPSYKKGTLTLIR